MRPAALLLLVPALAVAQAVTVGPGTYSTGPSILGEPSFAFELDALEQAEVSRPGWSLTTTRASVRWCETAAGWQSVAAGVPCIGRFGLASFGAGTNYWINSASPSLWALESTPVLTPQADGSVLVADDDTTVFEGLRGPAIATTVGTSWTVTCEVKAGTSATFRFGATGGTACTSQVPPSSWARVSCSGLATSTSIRGGIWPADNGNQTATGSLYVRQCQMEQNATPGPRHDCAGAACSWSADVHTVSTAGWPTSSGEIRLQYTPISGGGAPQIRALLDTRDPNNGVLLSVLTTNVLRAQIYSGGVAITADSSALTWVAGRTYEIWLRWSGSALTVWRDGVQVGSFAGAVLAPTAHAAAGHLGRNGAGTWHADGHIRLVRVSQ